MVLFDVICSKGTYIRTLCNDIGQALSCGGHMSFLLRTFSGAFDLKNSITMEEISISENFDSILMAPDIIFTKNPKIIIHDSLEKKILNGVKMNLNDYLSDSYEDYEIFPVYLGEKFVGVARRKYNGIYLEKLLA